MAKFVYLLERQKYIWRDNDWLANQTSSAWSSAIYNDYTIARASAKRDYYYMFNTDPDCIRFEKTRFVEELKQEVVVGRIVYTYKCCGETYKIIYRVTKKVLI
jgi:hypothetical protein